MDKNTKKNPAAPSKSASNSQTGPRKRFRDLGFKIGNFPTGKFNAITDVRGVKVGHATVTEDSKQTTKKMAGKTEVRPLIRSGVTVIFPNESIYNKKLIANSFVLNGAGEVSGLTQVNEWGLVETPIALTNTMSVGRVSDVVVEWMSKKFAKIWDQKQVVIPVVGECDDSFLNDAIGMHLRTEHVMQAIQTAKSGKIAEGAVGAGTGMICCDFKAGIGTASRVIGIGGDKYTIGVLVLSNFGSMEELRVDGFPLGKVLVPHQGNYRRRVDNYGSIITVIATDLPLSPTQIGRLCKRAALGIGRVGSYAAHGSGEIIVGFSTANEITPGKRRPVYNLRMIADDFLGPAYQATIESTEEAIINSLCMATGMHGFEGSFVPAIDLGLMKEYMQKYQNVVSKGK